MDLNETTIYPTHTAFDDVVQITASILKAHPDTLLTDEFVIVHGIIAPYGKELSSAWIEATLQERVIFIGIIDGKREMLSAPKGEYYADTKIIETTRYTFMEAFYEEKRTGRCGPWAEKYQKLCSDYTEASHGNHT